MPAVIAIAAVAVAAGATAVQINQQKKAEKAAQAAAKQQEQLAKDEMAAVTEQARLRAQKDPNARIKIGADGEAGAITDTSTADKGTATRKNSTGLAATGALDVSASRVGGL